MRIISKHKDYYDSCRGYGIDPNLVYLREEISLADRYARAPFSDPRTTVIHNAVWKHRKSLPYLVGEKADIIVVGFAGKLYAGLQFMADPDKPDVPINGMVSGMSPSVTKPPVVRTVWQAAQLNDEGLDEPLRTRRFLLHQNGQRAETIREWFDRTEGKRVVEELDSFLSINAPVYVYDGEANIFINPPLTRYHFAAAVDPFTAFQELSMFIGGVMTTTGPQMVEISDKDRLIGHGFDAKQSFRTRK